MLVGAGAGLAASPWWSPPGGTLQLAIALALSLIVLADRGRVGPAAAVLLCSAAALLGAGVGGDRIAAIDSGALRAEPGERLDTTGFVTEAAGTSRGITRIQLDTPEGRVMVESTAVPAGLRTGDGVAVTGTVREAPGWYRPTLVRQGIARILAADRVEATGVRRGGLSGLVDGMRNRASDALGRAMPAREAELARGFVLGQDDGIDDRTEDAFQDSGLSHLLAVSGQNIVLLGLLALPFMALAGLGPRSRLAVVAALILVYVPLTGAGPSIQRAGVMGLAGLAAIAASRPSSRIYALALAVVATLALNPRASGDIGWQLSFAAVVGIFLLAAPLRDRLTALVGDGPWATALADGIAVSVAATIATGPLIAFHFERFPVTTIVANLVALPAVAPAMWLGMISAALGQVAGVLAIPFNFLNSLVLGYIAQVAAWCSAPAWAVTEPKLGGAGALVPIYLVGAGVVGALLRWLTPERLGRAGPPSRVRRTRRTVAVMAVGAAVALVLILPRLFGSDRRELGPPPAGGARIEVLDVGQGDAILIRPHGVDPVLVDGGPPGGDLRGALASARVDRLEAVILTHGDLDHYGGLSEIFGVVPVGRFLFDGVPGALLRQARDAGARPSRIAGGQTIRAGEVRLGVLWPPARGGGGPVPAEEPNARSVVLELSVNGFRMLLTGDAEAEAAAYAAGPVDVLKVAHHGSDDAGLEAQLTAADPRVAVVSVGEDNRFGHPTPGTLAALAESGATIERTDRDGTVSIVVGERGYAIETGR